MVSAVVLIFLLHVPTPASAVSWPIERRYFEDEIPERKVESEGTEKSWTNPLAGIGFAFLPAGCFDMGDSAAGIVGEVCVDDFFLSRHEITNAQFRRFRSTHDSGSHLGRTLNDDDQPAVHVSWQDVMAFAAWLSQETGTPVRLATEAEWEYACGYGWSGSSAEKPSKFGNLREHDDETKIEGTAAVGSYEMGPQGLYDMHGNASEWVFDSYVDDVDRYGEDRNNPRFEIESPPLRVRRGGSWSSSATQSRCAARDYYLGDLAVPHTGFRLVAEPT